MIHGNKQIHKYIRKYIKNIFITGVTKSSKKLFYFLISSKLWRKKLTFIFAVYMMNLPKNKQSDRVNQKKYIRRCQLKTIFILFISHSHRVLHLKVK